MPSEHFFGGAFYIFDRYSIGTNQFALLGSGRTQFIYTPDSHDSYLTLQQGNIAANRDMHTAELEPDCDLLTSTGVSQ